MTLTVTPGGASDDALVSLTDFQSYCDARGHDYSPYSTDQQEQAIRRATVWIEGVGGPTQDLPKRWPGRRASATQRRQWPRTGAKDVDGLMIPDDAIPAAIQDAVCETAFYDLENPDVLHSQVTPTDVVKQEKIGPISVTYADGSKPADFRPMLTVVNDLLASILIPDLTGPSLYMQSVGKMA